MATNSTQGNNYPNPLDNYRSYSYHFILTLAGNTKAFSDQIGGGTSSSSQINQPAPLMSSVLKATAPGQSFNINGSDIYLIIDTRRFSSYSITDLNFMHAYGTGDTINPTTPAALLTMQVMDTTGLSFINMLMDILQNKLMTSRASACFLLSTIFVGHKDDGTTEVVSTMYTTLMLNLIGFSFDASGSKYEIDFIEQEGGADRGSSWSQQVNRLGSVASVTTQDKSNNIGGLMDALEEKLNVASLDFFQKLNNQANPNQTPPGKLVQYMITIPDTWRQFIVTSSQQNSYPEQKFNDIATQLAQSSLQTFTPISGVSVQSSSSYSTMSFSDASTITDAILALLETSVDFLKLSSKNKFDSGMAVMPKILMTITCDDSTYVVHYDVYPYKIPEKKDTTKQQQGQTQGPTTSVVNPGATNSQLDASDLKNVLHYSYLFSGQNDSIIDYKVEYSPTAGALALDDNPNIGANRFRQNSSAGQKITNVDAASKGLSKTAEYDVALRPKDPIFMNVKTKEERAGAAKQKSTEALPPGNAQDILKSKQEYTNSLAQAHYISTIQTTITVRGNPNIIGKYADRSVRGCPPHGTIISSPQLNTLSSSNAGTAAANYTSTLAKNISSAKAAYYANYYYPRIQAVESNNQSVDPIVNSIDVSMYPMYVMVGIFAPNVDSTGTYKSGEPMFTNAYFYNGPYRILFVETHFTDGQFSHVITMYPLLSTLAGNVGS